MQTAFDLQIPPSTRWGVDHTAFEVQISWLACATNAITSSNYSCSDAKTSVKCPFRFSLKTLWNKNCPNEVPPVQSFIIPTFDMSKGRTSPMVKDTFHNFVVHYWKGLTWWRWWWWWWWEDNRLLCRGGQHLPQAGCWAKNTHERDFEEMSFIMDWIFSLFGVLLFCHRLQIGLTS